MQGQCCDDAGDTALIKNKGVGPKWVETSIQSDLPDWIFIHHYGDCIDAWAGCKRALTEG